MKRFLLILLAGLLCLSLFACSPEEETPPEELNFVQFTMADGATFVVELYPDKAPETVANFKSLVSEGFYDGLTFHRIYAGFMIQGGCPKGNGSGNSGKFITGEFAANPNFDGDNDISHKRGVISMARSTPYDSASSQFFIMHADNSGLDGLYAAFGRVVRGMDVIDTLATVETTYNYRGEKSVPLNPPVIQRVELIDYKD